MAVIIAYSIQNIRDSFPLNSELKNGEMVVYEHPSNVNFQSTSIEMMI